jgi:hypothetical protein
MEFAEQERRPKQVVTPEYQSASPEGSKAEPTLKELTNGVDHSKIPKALQNTPVFGELPATPQQSTPASEGSVYPEGAEAPMLLARGGGTQTPVKAPATVPKPQLPKIPQPPGKPPGFLDNVVKGAKKFAPFAKGAGKTLIRGGGALGGLILEGIFAEPGAGEKELEWERKNRERQRQTPRASSSEEGKSGGEEGKSDDKKSSQERNKKKHSHGGGKNAQHGKAETPQHDKKIEELEEAKKNAANKKEKKKIQDKINNVRRDQGKKKKGENHSQGEKR